MEASTQKIKQIKGLHSCTLVMENGQSDLASISKALDHLNRQQQHEKKTAILSDLTEDNIPGEKVYEELAKLLDQKQIDRLIGIGPVIGKYEGLFNIPKKFYPSVNDFFGQINPGDFKKEAILIKGSPPFKFERISRFLQQKSHETILETNLNAVTENFDYFRERVAKNTKIMVMVKAFSYGSGSFQIANILENKRADYLGVAYADEGITLRDAGITLPVMVMNPEEASYDMMIRENLEPEIYNFKTLNSFEKAVRENDSFSGGKEAFPIHIKLETGFNRLGFEEKDLEKLLERLKELKHLRVKSIFSHLASTDIPEHDDFSNHQIEKFKNFSDKITAEFDHSILRHVLNTNGILRFPGAHMDMVRLGLGLYGIAEEAEAKKKLKQISSLKSSISQIKTVRKGETIGYARAGVAQKDLEIAIIPVGYADGLRRALSNGNWSMMVRGKPAAIIGNICMDMTMIDITGINAKEGDEVIILGKDQTVPMMAEKLQTIPYEVLTGISNRVKRVYVYDETS